MLSIGNEQTDLPDDEDHETDAAIYGDVDQMMGFRDNMSDVRDLLDGCKI